MDKLLSIMGISRKAGKLVIGHDAALLSVRNGRAAGVVLTSDASPRHKRELEAAAFTGKVFDIPYTMEDMGYAVGKKSCIFALEDEGFCNAIDKIISEEGI